MTRNQYRSLVNKLVVYPVRKLFPSLISTPYVAGAEHVYGLQQAISTNMIGEIKKSALNVVPGPRDFNRLIKGPKLDQSATGLIKNAYQTADVEKKQMYLDKANKLIDDFKKDFPGDYPKYKLTSKNNIVDVNISRVNKIKEPLFNKASTYIDYLVKTPGFLESNEFSNLPDTAKEIINAKVSKSKSFTNLLKTGIRKGGALAIAPTAAYLGYQALNSLLRVAIASANPIASSSADVYLVWILPNEAKLPLKALVNALTVASKLAPVPAAKSSAVFSNCVACSASKVVATRSRMAGRNCSPETPVANSVCLINASKAGTL